MKKQSYLLLTALSFLIISCGEKAREVKNAYELISNAPAMAENLEKSISAAEKKREERRAKGDTLAMPYQELQKYLPSISGYEIDGEAKGSTTNMPGMSFSSIEQIYRKDDNRVKVSLIDYNAAYTMYTAATAIWSTGMSFEDNSQKANSVTIDGLSGWEVFKKNEKSAELILGVGDRFLLTITADGQENTDFVKSIAKDMELESLAKL
ncbi:MAG TPA: hypothetical protein VIK89_14220 [Cytophagaceae bacterium]